MFKINCNYCWIEKTFPWNKIRKYCSIKCQWLQRCNETYKYFLTSPKEFQNSNFRVEPIKKHILLEQNFKCLLCWQWTTHNWKNLVLVLDHIDWNACNNTRENFRLVCPNCDTQLDTFKSRNKWKWTRLYTPSIKKP